MGRACRFAEQSPRLLGIIGFVLAGFSTPLFAQENSPPAFAADDCRLVKAAEIQLAFDAGGRPLAPVTLNGRERYLLIDTGGVYSTILGTAASDMGLESRRGAISLMNVEGETSDDIVIIEEFLLGTLRATDRPFVLHPGTDGPDSEIHFIGTLSPDILSNYDVDFGFGSNVMSLFLQDHCEGQVVYWQPQALAIIPFDFDNGYHITFPVVLDGVEMTAWLDTGAANSTLNRTVAERRLGLDFSHEEAVQVGVLGDDNDEVYRHTFEGMSFGGIDVREPTLTVLPDLMVGGLGRFLGATRLPEIIIGMSILSGLHVYIAYGERKLYITEAGSPAPAE